MAQVPQNQNQIQNQNIVINIDSNEASFRTSRCTQVSDFSINSHTSEPQSHLMTPFMGIYHVGAHYIIFGLRWHNNEYINSCNIDSFLTFLKLLALKHPNLIVAHLRLAHDLGETVIKEIVDGYVCIPKNNVALMRLQDSLARIYWAGKVLGRHPVWNQQVNLAGDESVHIFMHLRKSSTFQWCYECSCSRQYQFDTATCFFMNTAAQMQELKHSLDPSMGPRYRKVCKGCRTQPSYRNIAFNNTTTWIMRFVIQNPRFDYENLPNFLTLGGKTFKLGYVTFTHKVTQTMQHQTSCHLIQDQWFHYDGLNFNGELRKLVSLSLPAHYTPEGVVYYKWD